MHGKPESFLSTRVWIVCFICIRTALAARYFLSGSPIGWVFGLSELTVCASTCLNLRSAWLDTKLDGRLVPVLYMAPLALETGHQVSHPIFGALLVLAAVAILSVRAYMATCCTVGVPTFLKLLSKGPYARLRHPLAASEMLSVAILACCFPTLRNVALVVPVLLCIKLTAIIEERFLFQFGEYRAYSRRVRNRFWPSFSAAALLLLAPGTIFAGTRTDKVILSVAYWRPDIPAISRSASGTGLAHSAAITVKNAEDQTLLTVTTDAGGNVFYTEGTEAIILNVPANPPECDVAPILLSDRVAVSAKYSSGADVQFSSTGQVWTLACNIITGSPGSDAYAHYTEIYTFGGTPTPSPTPTPEVRCSWQLEVDFQSRCRTGVVGSHTMAVKVNGQNRFGPFNIPPGVPNVTGDFDGVDDNASTVQLFIDGTGLGVHTVLCLGDPHPLNVWFEGGTVGDVCNATPSPTPTTAPPTPGATPPPTPGPPPSVPPAPTPPAIPTPPPSTPRPNPTPQSTAPIGSVQVINPSDFYDPVKRGVEDAGQEIAMGSFPVNIADSPDFSDDGDIEGLTNAVDGAGQAVQDAQAGIEAKFQSLSDAWSDLPTGLGSVTSLPTGLDGFTWGHSSHLPATIDLAPFSGAISLLRLLFEWMLRIGFCIATIRAFSYEH